MSEEKKMTLEERYADDTLTDNTALDKYRQCKDCALRDDGTVYSNHYQKGSCAAYPYPGFKPSKVMLNTDKCEFYKKEG